jgi:glycosyltransferase involved in cell wall biosynthesis
MPGRAELSVVIPAYNEAARIGAVLEELQAILPKFAHEFEIRVVDNGSGDENE